MSRQIGQAVTDGPVAVLEARVHALEEKVSDKRIRGRDEHAFVTVLPPH